MTTTKRPKSKRKRWHIYTLGGIIALFVVIVAAGLSGPAPRDAQAPAGPKASSPAASFDQPTTAEIVSLRQGLGKIDGTMYGHMSRYVDRAVNTCDVIRHSRLSRGKLIDETVARFEGGDMPNFTREQASAVVTLVKRTFCD